MVLHTWGRNLSQHTHIHCLIPGGVLTEGKTWLATRKEGYLFPVKALSVRFKREMMQRVQQEIDTHENLLIEAKSKAWVVYSKPVLHHARAVVGYLSRYCNRIGLNPTQLNYGNNGSVEMTYKDHQSKTLKQMCCRPGEMLRRLLLHALPKGLMRIRYYGFLANAIRARAIADIRKSLSEQPHEVTEVQKEKPCCPNCKNRSMVLIRIAVRPRAIAEKERLS